MKKKKNKLFYLIIALAILIVFAAVLLVAVPKQNTVEETIKIGAILPLTGELASIGQDAKNAALLARQEIPEKERKSFELVFEDDSFTPTKTVSAFEKITSEGKTDAVVCFGSGPCNAIKNLAEEREITLIAAASDPSIPKGKKFVFRLEIAPSEEAGVLSKFIENKGFKRIVAIIALQDGVLAAYNSLKEIPQYSGVEVFSESVKPNEKDFRTVLSKALEKNPNAILVGLLPGFAGELGKQAKTLGFEGNFIGFNFLEGEETLASAQGSLEGIVYTNGKTNAEWFVEKFRKAFGKEPNLGAAHAFDALTMVIEAKKQGMEIPEFIESLKDFNGALGTYSSTKNHEFTIPVGLKTIKEGKFISYEESS